MCTLVLLAVALHPSVVSGVEARPLSPRGLGGPIPVLMRIYPDSELLVLDEEVEMPPQGDIPSLPALEGLLTFTVESPLPEWEVAIGVDPMVGPEGLLAMERVMVSSPETGGEFVPVADRPIIARGTGPSPAHGLWLRLRVAPEWVDAPGLCEGLLHLIPVVPDHVATEDPRLAGALHGGGEEEGVASDQPVAPGDTTWVGRVAGGGVEAVVPVQATIGSMTSVLASESEFQIHADAGPGLYFVEPDLDVVVASNEGQWELRLEGTPFVSGEYEIALGRMIWSLLGPDGEPVGPWTPLGSPSGNLLMFGTGERGVFPASFRFGLAVMVSDHAGDYISQITLVALPG